MNQNPNYKKQEQKAIMTMYLSIAFFTVVLVALAILLGVLITQSRGKSTFMTWVPLFAALPINLVISSVFSKKTTKKIIALRAAHQSTLNTDSETIIEGEINDD